jgi:hypothetical protein
VSDEPADDYFSTVAEVVEAAKQLEEAKRLEREADELRMRRYRKVKDAERVLHDALEKLGRTGPRK